ncbi:site-specific DNA-methyltransferase [Candidatus Bathyarchaeota archaeon]|nr:MAG: site-specific DNA-methyltransferase [Candidatus Bathyarchaeota archaeon]
MKPMRTPILRGLKPYYRTRLGSAYLGDARQLLRRIPDGSINLILTSPPFALIHRKEYGNPPPEEYVNWFRGFIGEFKRILTPDGSLVIHIGGSWIKGEPRKNLYNFQLLLEISRELKFLQDFYWFNPAKLPAPAEWVAVRRIRVKDAVDPIWWFSPTANPKADNRRVLTPYSEDMRRILRGEKHYRLMERPSGHRITEWFRRGGEGAIPPNLIIAPNTDSRGRYIRRCRIYGIKPHPARYPAEIPRFFIRFLTDPGDLVLDPFAGSNTTGWVAERLSRRWLSFEIREDYLKGSMLRFERDEIIEGLENYPSGEPSKA